MIKIISLFAVLSCLSLSSAQAREMVDMDTAVLRTIDKVSARSDTFDLPVGKTVKFGNGLFIKLRACRTASQLDKPEDAAFLQIWERKQEEDSSEETPAWVFSGWMFSSNPSLSAMNHPVYDVWLISCKKGSEKKNANFTDEATPEESADAAAVKAKAPAE